MTFLASDLSHDFTFVVGLVPAGGVDVEAGAEATGVDVPGMQVVRLKGGFLLMCRGHRRERDILSQVQGLQVQGFKWTAGVNWHRQESWEL